jgi:gliding motility-associated-like protein
MKKLFFVVIITLTGACASFANHITGGEMTYKYVAPGNQANTRKYLITLKLFRDEHTIDGAPMPSLVYIGIFNNDNNRQFPSNDSPFWVQKVRESSVAVSPYPPCVNNAPDLEYHVGYFVTDTIVLPNNNKGYTVAYQTCCRVNPLMNVFILNNSRDGTGSTYSCVIPPVIDSSPEFASSIDLICKNKPFTLNFNATDADDDSLVYSFTEAYNGGAALNATNINPDAPPYHSVEYINGFDGEQPLGNKVSINSKTGIISGIAPSPGKYVVCVSVQSYKKGVYTNTHRKDFIINIADCDFAGAQLDLKPVTCDGFTVSFTNSNTSVFNKTFQWNFGDPKSGAFNTSTLLAPTHQFSDTGVYVYKLIVNPGQSCSDSATQTVKVYPGFYPGFTTEGQCKNTPIQFKDTTNTKYGTVDSWSWNFGNPETSEDTSHVKNPSYTYPTSQDYSVQLIVRSNKGCIDTVTMPLTVRDKPEFNITNDTLICYVDTLQLKANGTGSFFWTPNYNISDQESASPQVSPDIPTTYYTTFSDLNGCQGTDSVFVDVRNFITLNAGNDTTICLTDGIVLNPASDALYYQWSPAGTLSDNTLKNPIATPTANTMYILSASIGNCKAIDSINIKVVPYPQVKVSNDSTICSGDAIQLFASGGSIYEWSPSFFLNSSNIPNPIANPLKDIRYIVSVSDTLGCPKAISDSILISVFNVIADAGPHDTVVVVDQPLQLFASGGEFYKWTPSTGLSNPDFYNPVARLNNSQQYVLKAISAGCSDTDTINVIVYKVDPGLYAPNAFTPGTDGTNDVFRPIPIGMKAVTHFEVYNRWGRLMYSSTQNQKGWDGTFAGKPQDAGVYVWIAEGIDHLDKRIRKKGSVVLVR